MTERSGTVKLCELHHPMSRVCYRMHGRSSPIRIEGVWYCQTCKEFYEIKVTITRSSRKFLPRTDLQVGGNEFV